MSSALSVENLSKSYPIGLLHTRRREVVHDLSFEVQRGEIFGYLGPNGSGKTTTLKVLTGLVFPDRGRITVLGFPHADPAWRHRVGYLPEHPYFYDYLTPREYLDYAGRLFNLPAPIRRDRTESLLSLVGLTRARDLPLRRFSKGMVQRLGIAQAMVNDPDLLLFDEPMSGLDPIGRRLVRNLIADLRKAGKTVFFSTHILNDAETLCDRVALVREGRLVGAGRLDEILKIDAGHLEVLVTGVDAAGLDGLPPSVTSREAVGERWRLHVEEPALGVVIRALEDGGGHILSVMPIRQSLEDLFFKEMKPTEGTGAWTLED
jgi:ABC-2 type transport system ATP-binding protein